MPYESTIAIRNNVAVTASGWKDIGGKGAGAYALPINCNSVIVFNAGSSPILLATDPGNANSSVTIPAGASWEMGTPSWGPRLGGPSSGCRFLKSSADVVCSLQSTSGNQNMTVEFVV